MKNIFINVGIVFAFVLVLSLVGCGDGEPKKKEAWRVVVDKQKAGEKITREEVKILIAHEEASPPPLPTKRLNYMVSNGLSDKYKGLSMPAKVANEDGATGRALYKKNCAMCHGSKGEGQGAMGKTLRPRPSNLLMVLSIPEATDAYLFWAVSEGGRAFRPPTAMPSFRQLSEADRWRIIAALRKGLK